MNIRHFIIAGTLIFVGAVTAIAYGFNTQTSIANPSRADGSPSSDPVSHEQRLGPDSRPGQPAQSASEVATLSETAGYEEYALPPLKFRREGAASPEDAAKSLFHACATRSPEHFVQHLLLGVCDGPINTLQKFAECLHSTRFRQGDDSLTVYDFDFTLPRGSTRKGPFAQSPARNLIARTSRLPPCNPRCGALTTESSSRALTLSRRVTTALSTEHGLSSHG